MIEKWNYIKRKEEAPKQRPLSIQEVYKSSPKARNQGGRKETKHFTFPYLEPSQSKKLTREEGLKTISTLTQDQRLHTKEYFNL